MYGFVTRVRSKLKFEIPLFPNLCPNNAEMDLNTKLLPKQKTVKNLKVLFQGFKITINKNPPTINFFINKF